jgi:hypothetical protein
LIDAWWNVPFTKIGMNTWRLMMKFVMGEIWLEKNRRIFQDKEQSASYVAVQIKIKTTNLLSLNVLHESLSAEFIIVK